MEYVEDNIEIHGEAFDTDLDELGATEVNEEIEEVDENTFGYYD